MTRCGDERKFPTEVVLSVTDGRLLCTFDRVHEFLEFMAGESVWTHQVPRVAGEATPVLLAAHPWLADVPIPEVGGTQEQIQAALDEWAVAIDPPMVMCAPLGVVEHTSVDPISEITMMRPDAPIVPVVIEDGGTDAS